jgi:hypothetical protein
LGLLFPSADTPRLCASEKTCLTLGFDYSSIYIDRSNQNWQLTLDMEIAETNLSGSKRLTPTTELGFEQRFFHLAGGFLDEFIITFHNTFGFPHYSGQVAAPRNHFAHQVIHKEVSWEAPLPNLILVGDLSFWIKTLLYDSHVWTYAAKVVVELPTGSVTNGLANGAPEAAFLLLGSWNRGGFSSTVNVGLTFPTLIKRGERYALRGVFTGFSALSYRFHPRWTAVIQTTLAASPYEDSGYHVLDHIWSNLVIGLKVRLPNEQCMSFGFLEDLSQVSPDFTVSLRLSSSCSS